MESWEKVEGNRHVSKREAFSDEVGLLDENTVEDLQLSIELVLVLLDGLLVKVGGRHRWENVSENSGEKVSLGKLEPLDSLSVGGSSGQMKSDRLSSEEQSISLEGRGL